MSLYKKLQIVRSVTLGSNYVSMNIVKDLLDRKEVVISECKWHDRFKDDNPDMYPLKKTLTNDTKRHLWSTYDGCCSIVLLISGNSMTIEMTIWNGSLLDGHREERRWSAVFTGLKAKHLVPFRHFIDDEFDRYALGVYLDEQETEKKLRIKKISRDLLT